MNGGIESEVCSLNYTSVDQAVRVVTERGRLTEIAKFDNESAYCLIPVHPDDRLLLGMNWREQLYVDAALQFGLRSAPKIFNAVADALQWILKRQGVNNLLHYLDDFMLFGDPGSSECQVALDGVLRLCQCLGVPIAAHKTEGPTTCLTFLGIELDSDAMEVRLPRDKLQRLKREIARPAISGGPIAARLLRGETRKNILEENDKPGILSERATLQDSAEQRLSRRLGVVGMLPPGMEWSGYDVKGGWHQGAQGQ